ncbi:hypothetical protein RhiirA5_417177 [Rhizophagus irregularis]|uniref:Uncharacterized protein n=1 Tax=Rhizophagus irregularis TaxID=588596 RepID=A0A2I1E0Q6_9GLOM|nr:hypothetical protein RhiirA5_417177 [Rhizophagus irregularis]PKY15701.1 hypothetical protein RhiirB3_427937 [Rhizophagus irregularis]GET57778.1 hypothetical protein GLOIN_2v1787061 [Rhizophagus irregularis DAOM 181602=DAOM 197198]
MAITKSCDKALPYLKFRNSFRGIDNYNFVSAQPWSSPCPICNGKHGIMDYMANGIKMERNIVLPVTVQAINLSLRL